MPEILHNLDYRDRLLREIQETLESEERARCKRTGEYLDTAEFSKKATRAARAAVTNFLGPSGLPLPDQSVVSRWDERDRSNKAALENGDPTLFLEKKWGKYLDEGVLDQCSLRHLDESLFDAIKTFCKNRDLDCQDYLPPASRKKNRSAQIVTAPRRPSIASYRQQSRPRALAKA
jgi:hypothetical protein